MSKLDQYKNQNPFQVPEGFFESMQNEVMQTISKENKKRLFRRVLVLTSSSAAAVLVAIVCVYIFWNQNAVNDKFAQNYQPFPKMEELGMRANVDTVVDEVVISEPVEVVSLPEKQVTYSEAKKYEENHVSNQNSISLSSNCQEPIVGIPNRDVEVYNAVAREYEEEIAQELYCDALTDLDICFEY